MKKEAGQASKILLILFAIILAGAVIAFIVLKASEKKPAAPVTDDTPKVFYEQTIGSVKFTFINAIDEGSVLRGSQSRNPSWQKDLVSTDRFIIVTIGAQNKGKENVPERYWELGDIIDSDDRHYEPLQYSADPWEPYPDSCGSLLKPEFEPTPCVKIYEVSKISTGLKVQVLAGSDQKKQSALIDLIVK